MAGPPQQPPAPRTTEDQVAFLARQVEELRLLQDQREHDLQDQERSLRIDELKQRMLFRNLVLLLAVAVVVLMALFAYAGTCIVLAGGKVGSFEFSLLTVPSSYAIALFVAPITSISLVSVALMVGTFRRFKDSDADTLAGVALDTTKAAVGHGS